MPDYDWVCHACKAFNTKGTEHCLACDKPAVMSAADIDPQLRHRNVENPKPWHPIFTGLIAIYLLAGSIYTFVTGKWFVGFPVQLDLFYFFGFFSPAGAYVEATLAAILGVFCLVGLLPRKKRENT